MTQEEILLLIQKNEPFKREFVDKKIVLGFVKSCKKEKKTLLEGLEHLKKADSMFLQNGFGLWKKSLIHYGFPL